jgi:hypothetical protein
MQLVAIGNSKGIRISKQQISKYGFDDGVYVVEEKDGIKIMPSKQGVRDGWGNFYKSHASNMPIDADFLNFGIGDEIE